MSVFESLEPRQLLSSGYSIVDLSASAAAAGVSAAGVSAINPNGTRIVGLGTSGGFRVPIVWEVGRQGRLHVSVLLSNGATGGARAVNNAGQIVGWLDVPQGANSTEVAVVWHYNRNRQRYRAVSLGTTVGGQTGEASTANAINASGLVAGQIGGLPNPLDNNSNTRSDAVGWKADGQGGFTAINLSSNLHQSGTSGLGLPADGPFSATAVNDAGAIVGSQSNSGGFAADAYAWTINAQDIATATHVYGGDAADVTSDGAIPVNTAVGDNILADAVLMLPATPGTYQARTFHALPGGARSLVSGMNDHGVAVGSALAANGGPSGEPVLWRAARHGELKPTTLFSQIPVATRWSSLDSAVGIDERGDIIGTGTARRKSRAFLLIPNK